MTDANGTRLPEKRQTPMDIEPEVMTDDLAIEPAVINHLSTMLS